MGRNELAALEKLVGAATVSESLASVPPEAAAQTLVADTVAGRLQELPFFGQESFEWADGEILGEHETGVVVAHLAVNTNDAPVETRNLREFEQDYSA